MEFVKENHEALHDALDNARKARRVINISAGGFISYEFSKINQDIVKAFFNEFQSPNPTMARGNGAYLLYRTLSDLRRNSKHALNREWLLAVSIKAMNAYMHKRTIRQLKFSGKESFPEITKEYLR